jgi:hypothetical protein
MNDAMDTGFDAWALSRTWSFRSVARQQACEFAGATKTLWAELR